MRAIKSYRFAVGFAFGLLTGASVTAHAASDLERYAARIATALERIAQAVDHGKAP